MKIGDNKPVGRSAPGRIGKRDASSAYARAEATAIRAPADSATILGIPEPELTPKVREAIMTLMHSWACRWFLI